MKNVKRFLLKGMHVLLFSAELLSIDNRICSLTMKEWTYLNTSTCLLIFLSFFLYVFMLHATENSSCWVGTDHNRILILQYSATSLSLEHCARSLTCALWIPRVRRGKRRDATRRDARAVDAHCSVAQYPHTDFSTLAHRHAFHNFHERNL